jgi:hypothetical protein
MSTDTNLVGIAIRLTTGCAHNAHADPGQGCVELFEHHLCGSSKENVFEAFLIDILIIQEVSISLDTAQSFP